MSLLGNIILTEVENNRLVLDLRSLVHLEANPLIRHQTLLTIHSHVVIVVCSMLRIDVLLLVTLALNVIRFATSHQCAEAVPVLPRIQGNSIGHVVEAEHPEVEVSPQGIKSTKQQRYRIFSQS